MYLGDYFSNLQAFKNIFLSKNTSVSITQT